MVGAGRRPAAGWHDEMTKRYTRRKFLALGGGGGTALAAGIVPAPAATPLPAPGSVPAEPRPGRPLPELVSEDVLPISLIDPEASNAAGKLIGARVRDGNRRAGIIFQFPEGSIVHLQNVYMMKKSRNYDPGNRTIFRSEGMGASIFKKPGTPGSLIVVRVKGRLSSSLEFERMTLDMGNSTGGKCVAPLDVRYLRFDWCDLRGGSNTVSNFTYPMIVEARNSEFSKGGRDNRKHVIYLSYCESALFENCHLHSPRSISHILKLYGRKFNIRNCLIETYDDEPDFIHPNYSGWMMDISSWADTKIVGNTIINKTRSTNTLVYRNRQYPVSDPRYMGYGDEPVVDYHLVDNTDDGNPHLFRHLLMDNMFGHEGEGISGRYAVRNSGTFQWISGARNPLAMKEKPADWQDKNERAVVYAVNNQFSDYYANKFWGYDTRDDNRRLNPAPIRELDAPPAWFTG